MPEAHLLVEGVDHGPQLRVALHAAQAALEVLQLVLSCVPGRVGLLQASLQLGSTGLVPLCLQAMELALLRLCTAPGTQHPACLIENATQMATSASCLVRPPRPLR